MMLIVMIINERIQEISTLFMSPETFVVFFFFTLSRYSSLLSYENIKERRCRHISEFSHEIETVYIYFYLHINIYKYLHTSSVSLERDIYIFRERFIIRSFFIMKKNWLMQLWRLRSPTVCHLQNKDSGKHVV